MNRPSVPNVETVWRLGQVQVKGDCRLRKLNRLESVSGWNQAVWKRSNVCAGDRGGARELGISRIQVPAARWE
jgi:hypothetical protein